ncbi:MAG: hypothetical protein FJY76_02575 [Candidatus Aenigmarchaeota archaeon]|nr:hypothetical protein [Candidatus Aenigmarchaeota archaeon]
MKAEFSIISADYVMEGSGKDEKPAVRLWGRTRQGRSILVLDRGFQPYFYVHYEGNGNELRQKIMKLEVDGERPMAVELIERKILGRPAKLLKVVAQKPASVPKFRDLLKEWKDIREEYEYAIPFHKRYLIDRKLRPLGWAEAEGRNVKYKADVDVVMEANDVKPAGDEVADAGLFRVLSFAVGMKADRLESVSLAGSGGFRKTISGSEKQVVGGFVSAVKAFNPDFIAGYDSDRHDFVKLNAKAMENRTELALGRDGSRLVFARRGYYSSAEVAGRPHMDLYNFVDNILSPSMSAELLTLESVAEELAGENKLKGAELVLKLAEQLLPQIFEISNLVGQDPFDASRMAYSQLVESLLMREAYESGEVILNRPKSDEIARRVRAPSYEGGYVHQPKQGLHENIALFDFASLYPSITITHNISPETLDCDDGCRDIAKAHVPELDHYFCTKKRGFIPRVLQNLVLKRSELKARMRKLKPGSAQYRQLYNRQYAMKIIANASYGYYGYAGSRWYSRIAAECITAWGRHYIKKVIELAQQMGYDVIYGDTDSLFLKVKNDVDAKKFLMKANSVLPGVMEMDLQGIYKAGIFVPTKAGIAAKKRYALLDSKGSLTIRGFEKVRRDWSVIAKDTQEAVLRFVLKDKSPAKAADAVRKSIARLEKGHARIPELVIYTQLTKPLSTYEQIGPHVAAARKMEKAGIAVGEGTNIAYVIAKGEGSISDRAEPAEAAHDYDPDYYVNNQVIPAALRVLSIFGYDEESLKGAGQVSGQPSLASFAKPTKLKRRPRR